ncbi:MAG TPA: DUF255 domain-containing protein [Longimicrobiales bacterium]|nr:DUF255 domain-containing protein [Longimicrobiales bacterium]
MADKTNDRVQWRSWGREAFEEAARSDTPILLNLTTFWCGACREMEEGTYGDALVAELLNNEVIPVRVDGDRHPHIQDRYIAGGWPTVAILVPTGEVFWSGTYTQPRDLRRVIEAVREAWRDRREGLREEVGRRRKAMEAARSRRPAIGIVRREAADDVLTGAQDQFDPRNGGFGQAPKFVHAEAIELLFTQADRLPNPDWAAMAERTLDGMLAGAIEDAAGGFFHYALEADWTRPQTEKLLHLNARVLDAYAFGAAHRGRDDWREAAERTMAWVEGTLRRPDGLWSGSQAADPAYYGAEADARAALDPPAVDGVACTHSCAMWIAAMADAGRRLDRDDWIERASTALDSLLETMAAPDDSLVHYDDPSGDAPPTGLLLDLLHTARAATAVAEAAGRKDALAHARRLVTTMERTLWHDQGAFMDHPPVPAPLGALRYQDRPFEENALAARLLLRLVRATGERGYRAMAERILAVLSPLAGRYAVEGATFAMAVEEFFELRGG